MSAGGPLRGSVWYRFVRFALRGAIFPALGGLRTVGEEHIPREGGVILAPNHVSNFDPPAIAAAISRPIRIVAKEELFRNPLVGAFNRSLGAFPVRRGKGDAEAVRQTLLLIEAGWAMIVFPEGTRSDGTRLLPLGRGVELLARRAGCPVVPAAVVGTHILQPKGAERLRRARVTIAFGAPMRTEEFEGGAKGAFTNELDRRIRRLAAEQGMPLGSEAEGSA